MVQNLYIQQLTPGFKNYKNLDNFRQVVESPKSSNLMGYFCPKDTFLQLKHFIPKIYLTLLSITSVKIHQIIYDIFETISNFSRHNSSVFFKLKHYILSTKEYHQSASFQTSRVKVHQISHVIFQTESFSSKFRSVFSVMRDNSSVLF